MVKVNLVIKDNIIEKRHKDEALKWGDDETMNWISDDTGDSFDIEELYFARADGSMEISLTSGDNVFLSLTIGLVEWLDAATTSNFPLLLKEWIKKAEEVAESLEQ